MSAAFDSLVEHFERHGFKYRSGGGNTILTEFWGDSTLFHLMARITDGNLFRVRLLFPFRSPEGARPSIAEAITRANCGLKVGKFELDLSDGEISFRVSHLLSDDYLPDEVIEQLVGTAMWTVDHYVGAFLSIIYSNDSPHEAIARIEANITGGE